MASISNQNFMPLLEGCIDTSQYKRNGALMKLRLTTLIFLLGIGGCGSGGGDDPAEALAPITNPGASAPVDIRLSSTSGNLTVIQGESMSFPVSASLVNKGSNSQGLVISVSCPTAIQCSASPTKFSSSGTTQITVFAAQNSPVGGQRIEIIGSETHATGLGILGPLVRSTRSLFVTISAVANHSALAFDRRSSFRVQQQSTAITIYDIDQDGMNVLTLPNGTSSFAVPPTQKGRS
jgi:hypothetical protein